MRYFKKYTALGKTYLFLLKAYIIFNEIQNKVKNPKLSISVSTAKYKGRVGLGGFIVGLEQC